MEATKDTLRKAERSTTMLEIKIIKAALSNSEPDRKRQTDDSTQQNDQSPSKKGGGRPVEEGSTPSEGQDTRLRMMSWRQPLSFLMRLNSNLCFSSTNSFLQIVLNFFFVHVFETLVLGLFLIFTFYN